MNSTAKWLTARQAALSRSFGQGWTIMARWASSKAPRSSMSTLPPPPSSAGVPSTSTVTPSSSATSASASAAPTEDAPMMLWPQAWPTSGSASYSAHRATTRGPSPKRAEKAVSSWQIPRSTAIPDADRTSVSWSTAKRSSKASSGRAWMAWLSVTSRSRCRSSAWRARALRSPAVLATEPGLLDDRDHVTPADRGPLGHSELGDGAVLVGRDRVLHLHSLEDANGLACLDRVADRDQDPDDGPLHGNGDRPGAGGAGRRAPVPPGDRSGNLRPWRRRPQASPTPCSGRGTLRPSGSSGGPRRSRGGPRWPRRPGSCWRLLRSWSPRAPAASGAGPTLGRGPTPPASP